MKHTLTRPILHVLALLVLVSLLAPGAAAQRAPVPAPASGARLTAEQAIAVVMSSMEVGANDFRLSDMGQDNTYDAHTPAVAYNSTDDEYLVVWYGDDSAATQVDGEYEISGRRVDAATGKEIGLDLRLSDMGPDGDPAYDAWTPAVAYNSAANEYLVVWYGDDSTALQVEGEYEIFCQRVEANTGNEIGSDLRLSNMGPNGDPAYDAWAPAVAYNSTANEYLVVWHGDDNDAPLVDGEYEIFAQRVSATGAQIGAGLRISAMGPDGSATYGAIMPDVAYNSTDNEYLVVWHGDDMGAALVDDEFEVYGQRLDAAGNQVGHDDLRLSDMGPDGFSGYDGGFPSVAYNPIGNEYLVVWTGDDNTVPLVNDEFEIFGQLVNAATGAQVGVNDFRLSDMGPDGVPSYSADQPAVAYDSHDGEYLVVWHGDDNTAPLVDDEFEVFGQRVDAARGGQVGANDFRLSDMGPDGDPDYDASYPAVAYNGAGSQYLAVWEGDDNTSPLVDEEYEIHGQRVDGATGAELGADRRLSDAGPGPGLYLAWFRPAVAYSSAEDEYLVVWTGSDNAPPLVEPEMEIYGQRVDAATGAEVGANDLRISAMGPDGDTDYVAAFPAVAYNSLDNEYLVVWMGSDDLAGLDPGERDIYVQRLDAATGDEVGPNDLRISSVGPDGDPDYAASYPAVAYDSANNQYLVVWSGDDDTPPLVQGEEEIFGQLLTAEGGQLGPNDFRLSDMGPDGDTAYDTIMPDVTYNSVDQEYLVVWYGDDDTGALVDEELEIFAQRIEAATGAQIGTDRRLSDMGQDGDPSFDAGRPAVAHNNTDNEYLVVWHSDDDTPPLVDEELEVYAQRLDGATGAEIGANDFRLSAMGPDGDPTYGGGYPDVVYNSSDAEYLVVWFGDAPPLAAGEYEVYGQRLDAATGAEIGGDDLRLSDMGPDGDPLYVATAPALAHNSLDNEYLVVWMGDDNTPPLVNDEMEVFGQRLRSGSYRIYLPLVLRDEG